VSSWRETYCFRLYCGSPSHALAVADASSSNHLRRSLLHTPPSLRSPRLQRIFTVQAVQAVQAVQLFRGPMEMSLSLSTKGKLCDVEFHGIDKGCPTVQHVARGPPATFVALAAINLRSLKPFICALVRFKRGHVSCETF
jgi:hypothetical protein